MVAIPHGLVLCTSDSRPRYRDDALTVLALPGGAHFQFRYSAKYIPADVRHCFDSDDIAGTRCIVAFRSRQAIDECIIPVRFVSLTNVERIADFYIVRFSVAGFPDVGRRPTTLTAIAEESKEYLESLATSARELPVQQGFTALVDLEAASTRDSWLWVARRLSLHPTFSDTFFLHIDGLTTASGTCIAPRADGCYQLTDRGQYRVGVYFYSANMPAHPGTLEVASQPDVVRVASSGQRALDSKYDSWQVWLQTPPAAGRTLTELGFTATPDGDDGPTSRVALQVEVRRSRRQLTVQTVVSALSGGFLALPAILGPSAPLEGRIASSLLGALLLAMATGVLRAGVK